MGRGRTGLRNGLVDLIKHQISLRIIEEYFKELPAGFLFLQAFEKELNNRALVVWRAEFESRIPNRRIVIKGPFAPHARIRAQIVPRPMPSHPPTVDQADHAETDSPRPARAQRWAELLARVFGLDMQKCVDCGGSLKMVSAILEPHAIKSILTHLRLPEKPPELAPQGFPNKASSPEPS